MITLDFQRKSGVFFLEWQKTSREILFGMVKSTLQKMKQEIL